MITILGAGGAIGSELVRELAVQDEPIRLVSRNPTAVAGGAETVAADLSSFDDTLKAVAGSRLAFLLAGLKYDVEVWRELWPRIMRNALDAAKLCDTRLVFFDNVYMYGRIQGAMTEDTPFRPCSEKGEIRAEIATMLLNEIKAGNVTALIARCADFFGPGARNGIPNILVFDKLAQGKKAMCVANDSAKHSYTFTTDAARSLALLANSENTWNQTWHVPTAPNPPTGKQFIELVAKEFGAAPRYRILSRRILRIGGWFDTTIREMYEMLYQNEFDYVFDSTKFTKAFQFQPTSYAESVHRTAQEYRR